MAAPRRASRLLRLALASAGSLMTLQMAFVMAPARGAAAEAGALGLAAPTFLGASSAVAGEPLSVGDHWYWNLGGETASIIPLALLALLVLLVLVPVARDWLSYQLEPPEVPGLGAGSLLVSTDRIPSGIFVQSVVL